METENEIINPEQPETPPQNDLSTEEETARHLAAIEAENKPVQPPFETTTEPEPKPKPAPKEEIKQSVTSDKPGFSFDLLTIAILGLAIALVYLIYIKMNNDE